MVTVSRRGFLGAAASLLAAPTIVRVASIMPVKQMPSVDILDLLEKRMEDAYRVMAEGINKRLYCDPDTFARAEAAAVLEEFRWAAADGPFYNWHSVSQRVTVNAH